MRARAFLWNDLPALAQLMDRVRQADGDERMVDESCLKEALGIPSLTPEKDCYIIESASALRAYAVVHPELPIGRAVLEAGMDPHHRTDRLGAEVLRVALARTRELGAKALHLCTTPSEFWRIPLEQERFVPVRNYWLMRWQGSVPPPLDLPPGFSISTYLPEDADLLAQLQNAAFADNWGFCPNSKEDVAYRAAMSLTGPGGILFLNHGAQRAGYCWTLVEKSRTGPPVGTIGMIGIHPTHRGQSLSMPILAAGMHHLMSRGVGHIKLEVDAENAPAIRLYAGVGFKKALELRWYEARLPTV